MLWLALGALLAGHLHAAVITVGPGGGYNCTTITAALTNAVAGDTIQVAPGIYSTSTSETFPLRLQQPVTLESLTTNTQPHLQGDSVHTVVSIETGGVTVRGFRITDGLGSEGINLMDGGGICVFVGPNETNTVHIEDCLIEDNGCTYDETYDGCGGGIYCGGTYCECFQIHIRRCVVRNNSVPGNGAGVCCALLSILRIEDTLIQDNIAEDNGGGVYVDVYGFAVLTDNTRLVSNSSIGDLTRTNFGGKGGGLFCESYGFFALTNCLVAGNSAMYYGGGIFTRAGDRVGDDPCLPGARTPEIAATLLATNWARVAGGGTYLGSSAKLVFNRSTNYWNDAAQDGGAVYVADGVSSAASVRFTNDCLLEGNQCAGRGGGVFLGTNALGQFAATRFLGNSALLDGGAVFQQGKSSSAFTNCLLSYNNSARGYGGGLYLASLATNSLARCTVAGNFAPFGRSGLCLNTNASLAVSNCILWRNAGGSIQTNGATVQVSFSLYDSPEPLFVGWGTKSGLYVNSAVIGPGSGTAADPYRDLQVGLDGFDFRLATNSPCIGTAGDGGNQGATTGTGGAAGGTVASLNLTNGIYDIRGRNIIFTRGLQGNGSTGSFIRNAVFGYVEDTYIRDLSITGERWFGGIAIRANVGFERCAVASNNVLTDGGGIYVAQGQCVASNSAVSANQSVRNGGGLFVATNAALTVDASSILGNRTFSPGPGNGAGIYGSAASVLLVTNNSLIAGNVTPNDGGGAYLEADTSAAVAASEVSRNSANYGAGIYELGSLIMTDSRMLSNSASLHVGALHLGASATGTVARTIIAFNSAASTVGGIHCQGSAWISGCYFQTNQAVTVGALQVQIGTSLRPVRCENTHFLGNIAESIAGAVRCWVDTAPVFVNCEFVGNSANNGGAGALWTGSRAVFANCLFAGSHANTRGGAFYIRAAAASFQQCDFANSTAGSDGGTAHIWSSDTSSFEQCTFNGEKSGGSGGSLSITDSAAPLLQDAQIANCSAAVNGGGIACRSQSAPRFESVVISNSTAVLGGGLYADGTSVSTFHCCQFLGNVATNTVGSPDGGGANFTGSAAGRLACCWFDGNTALDDGGALSVSGSGASASLTNCFLANNRAVNSGGGAHFTLNGSGLFQNCTVVSNGVQVSNGGGVYRETTCPVTLDSSIVYGNQPDGIAQSGGSLNVNYSCIQEPWPGMGNIPSDPLLNPLNSSLLDGSPCIDAGNTNLALNDACLPPGKATARNDMGASGGPGNCCQVAPAGLIHRYSFDLDARDSIGTAHGTLMNGATVNGGAVNLNGANQYVDLPGGLLNGLARVTFEFWSSFGINGNWARVFDFGDRSGSVGKTYVFFSPHGGVNHTLAVRDASGTERRSEQSGVLDGLTNVHVVCVYDPPTSTLILYLNGMADVWRTDASSPLSEINNVYSWLGRSLYSGNAYLNGSLNEFRIYDFALSSGEVWQSYLRGPDAPLPSGPAGPAVSFAKEGASLKLSWPDALLPWEPVWNLYGTTSLVPPLWMLVTNAVTHTNGQVLLTLPLEGPHRYFRLQSP